MDTWVRHAMGYVLTDAIVVGRGDASSIIDDFYGLETIVLETSLCSRFVVIVFRANVNDERHVPILVAWASRLFSTSSFTAVCKSTTT